MARLVWRQSDPVTPLVTCMKPDLSRCSGRGQRVASAGMWIRSILRFELPLREADDTSRHSCSLKAAVHSSSRTTRGGYG